MKRGRCRRCPVRPLWPAPRRGLPPRLRHAPGFPEQPARLHVRAVEAERRSDAHHEVGTGREVGRVGTRDGPVPPRLAAPPRGAPGLGSGRSPRGAGASPPDSEGFGALRSSAREINNVPWAGRTPLSPVFRGLFLFASVNLFLWREKL